MRRIRGSWFIQLYSRNNTFYFRLPNSFPDMYAIACAGSMASGGSVAQEPYRLPDATNLNGKAGLYIFAAEVVVGLTANIVMNGMARHAVNKNYPVALSGNMRECFLDMDSGDIVYY